MKNDAFRKFTTLLDSAVRNLSRAFYDQYVEANTRFRAKAGLKVTIIREELGTCCDWCADLAGIYSYDSAPKDVWARHANCKCMVTTRTEKGTYQDAWSRKEYKNYREARIAREAEIEKEITSRQLRGLSIDSSSGFYNGLTRKEMAERAKRGKNISNNQGIIADKVLNGEISLKMKMEKYKQHSLGTKQYNRACIDRGREQSYLVVEPEKAQQIIYDNAGWGVIDNTYKDREYLDYADIIGYYHKNKEPLPTNRYMIIYAKDGAHIVPVKPR